MAADDERDKQIQSVLHNYLQALDAGNAPPQDDILRQYPDLAEELRAFFADQEKLNQMADSLRTQGPPRPPSEPLTIDSAAGSGAGQLGTVKYFGDYELLGEIARGGMGVVYKARQVSLNRIVAIKMILAGELASSEAVERFYAEAKTAANLQHPHIVAIHEVGRHEGQHYFSMDYVQGHSLADVVRDAILPPEQAARYVRIVAEAIHFAHQQGTLHRDLKPSNVLIDQFDQPRVTDFGLAKRVEGDSALLTATGAVLGTPSYMSPEQASADRGRLSVASDVYSLGAVLYELVTGRPPFRAANPIDTILQVLSVEPAAPRLLNPAVSRDLETIILKCLSKESGKRYGSAQELADDLRRFLEHEPIQARRPGPAERALRWLKKRRRSALVATGAASLAALLLIGGFLAWSWQREARLGRLVLTTSGHSLVAEIVDDAGSLVVPRFVVPTQQPAAVPPGNHRLRLSASEMLSETYELAVERGARQEFNVAIGDRRLWEPITVRGFERVEVIDVSGHADLIMTRGRSLSRLDGATSQQVWDLTLDARTLPAGRNLQEWSNLLGGDWHGNFAPSLVRPAPDLDSDGVGDLVAGSRTSLSLLAISGRDGRLLWWHRTRSAKLLGVDLDKVKFEATANISGQVIGGPASVDVDGDKVPDMIAVFRATREIFRSQTGERIDTGEPVWVEAMSGRSGKPLWRFEVDPHWLKAPPGVTDSLYPRAVQPTVVRLRQQPVLVLSLGRWLLGLEGKTGKEAWPAHDLGFAPKFPMQFADLTGDGEAEAVIVHEKQTPEGNPISQVNDRVLALPLPPGPPLWETPFAQGSSLTEDWTLLADLDGDGIPEIVNRDLHDASTPGRSMNAFHDIAVLAGATGATKWKRHFELTDQFRAPRPTALTAGPDIDGDGQRDLFVAWIGEDNHTVFHLGVEAISGHDGHTLWVWQQTRKDGLLNGRTHPLRWWQTGPDGWPQLVLSVDKTPFEKASTYILSAAKGQLMHVVPDLADPQVADLNGDGVPDLCCLQSGDGGAKLHAFRGATPEPFRLLETWSAAQDYDGDGSTDLVSARQHGKPLAVSGRTGQLLWRGQIIGRRSNSADSSTVPLPSPDGDLDGDRIPDVLVIGEGLDDRLQAISGKDGQRLWKASWLRDRPGEQLNQYRHAVGRDLDGDGQPEIVLLYETSAPEDAVRLAVLSGRAGQLRWSASLGRRFHDDTRLHPGIADLDGDGVLDVLAWAQPTQSEYLLLALNGKTGARLWQRPVTAPPLGFDLGNAGVYARVGDLDGDGRSEVVFTEYHKRTISALNGADGQPIWSWSWTEPKNRIPDAGLPSPLLLRTANSRHLITIPIRDQDMNVDPGSRDLVLLDHVGKVAQHIAVRLNWPFGWRRQVWSHDLDDDGSDELLVCSAGRLRALRLDGKLMWEWPIPNDDSRALGSDYGHVLDFHSDGDKATVAVWANNSVFGLDAATGIPQWRCGVFLQNPRLTNLPVALLRSGDPGHLPRVLLTWPSGSGSTPLSTICRQAWPTRVDGAYQR